MPLPKCVQRSQKFKKDENLVVTKDDDPEVTKNEDLKVTRGEDLEVIEYSEHNSESEFPSL